MTYEELKAEAKAQGFRLVKIPPKIPFLNCVCGRTRRSVGCWYGPEGRQFKCENCGFKGGWGKNEREAKILWNKAVTEATKGEKENGVVQLD